MRRFSAKVDESQNGIVIALREIGASVEIASAIGQGFPDLIVGYKGQNFLLEVKNPVTSGRQSKLNDRQIEWHNTWKGSSYVVRTPEEAIQVITQQTNGEQHSEQRI